MSGNASSGRGLGPNNRAPKGQLCEGFSCERWVTARMTGWVGETGAEASLCTKHAIAFESKGSVVIERADGRSLIRKERAA